MHLSIYLKIKKKKKKEQKEITKMQSQLPNCLSIIIILKTKSDKTLGIDKLSLPRQITSKTLGGSKNLIKH
jgi:CRISPR/Cas system-associated protein endoribonuclease Cas2